mmetsp:Transcript_29394/g.56809  ORF Transcript_29394/g.56809 Transcript_29394/m.56809 type:complete len:352 (-) Transcript_29394:784-1839(-)
MASSNISIQQRQQRAINLKWGPQEINGLDQRRAEAIGLEPAVLEVGYGATPTGLPSLFRDAGTCARFVRRTAELLLENSQRWKQIEINTRETNKYYKELLVTSRVREAAYRVAADLLTKIIERPSLLNVWENSCPNLLRSKTRELELQTEGTPAYNEALKEKLRIDLIYDAVAELKKIEQERPLKKKDIADKQKDVAAMAHAEQAKILKQEAQLAKELKDIGDGSESILRFSACLQAALPSCELSLSQMELLVLPVEVFSMTHLTLLNVSGNSLKELPSEVSQLSALEKLYVTDNQLRSLPLELHRLLARRHMAPSRPRQRMDRLGVACLPGAQAFNVAHPALRHRQPARA